MTEYTIEEILKQLDTVRFYQDHGLKINKKTGKSWPCECPFCGDKKHFNLTPTTGLWQCFKCNEAGNQITFYAKMKNCNNGEAVKGLKEYLGIKDEKPERKSNKGKGKSSNNSKSSKAGASASPPSSSPTSQSPQTPGKTHVYERLIQLAQLTPEHREELHKKRGFSDQIIDLLRFRSGGEYLSDVVTQLQGEYTKDELVAAGILVEVNGTTVVNNQLHEERVLIPYMDEAGQVYHLRPHKLGFKDIPVEPYCRFLLKNSPEHVILTEGEFKAAALLQWGIPATAIPGISSFGGANYERLVEFFKLIKVRKITIIFDSEDKSNPEYPNFKEKIEDRYDTQYWSYMMAYNLGRSGFQTRIGWLPEEWRQNGKIDFDGALAQGKTRTDIETVINAAKTPKEFKESLPEEASRIVERKVARNFAKQNIKRDFNKYVAVRYSGNKSYEEIISNFVINIKSSFYTPSGVIRNVELINQYGEESEAFAMEPGCMAGVNEFKKFLLSKGNYLFYGNTRDLTNIWDYEFLRDSGELVWMPEQIGRISSNLWLFGNILLKNGMSYKPDNDGIIWLDGKGYKPQSLDFNSGNGKDEAKIDSMPILAQRNINIVEVAERMKHCIGGYKAYVMIGWAIAAIFSKDIFHDYKCIPILFPHGKKGSGKTTALRWLMNFFGIDTEGIKLDRSSTHNGIIRQLAYFSSLAIWLDEYRNENYVTDKDGLFRSVYNRQASVKGTATSFQTKSFVVRGTLIISGEELPKDAGLLSRCIPLQFSEHQRNRQWFNWLNQHASQFSGFTFHLLLNYEHYKPQILDCIKDMKEALIEKGVTDRTAENWAICAGAFWAVVKQDNEFVKWIMESCQEATLIDEEANMLNQFWDDVNYLVSEGTIGDKYFRVENEKLLMWFEGIYVAWSIHYRKKAGRDPFDKVSIIKYLKDEPYYQGSSLKRLANTPRRVHAVLIEKAPDAVQEIAAGIAKYTNF